MTNAAQYLLSALQAVGISGHFDGSFAGELVTVNAGPTAQIWITDHDSTLNYELHEHDGWLACYYPDLVDQGSEKFTVLYSSDNASIEEDTPNLIKAIQAALNGQSGEPDSALSEGATS
ncbi:hypothetical protein ACIBCO_28950 [Streptomyces violascens]|uniref:hypothetical protein n=1 Tax=Streptomyces violascens TaxID=67381 RepID=UPI00378C0726